MSVLRSSKQLGNVCSSGSCSNRSTQRQQTTSAHIWHRQPRPQGTGVCVFLWLHHRFMSTKWACDAVGKHLGCSAANSSTAYYASCATRRSRHKCLDKVLSVEPNVVLPPGGSYINTRDCGKTFEKVCRLLHPPPLPFLSARERCRPISSDGIGTNN